MTNKTPHRAETNSPAPSKYNPDLLLQYSAGSKYPASLEPEVRLIITILEDAVSCYQLYFEAKEGRARREFEDAERWLFRGGRDWIFSFENICSCVGLDANHIRTGLRRWREMAVKARQEGKAAVRAGRRVIF